MELAQSVWNFQMSAFLKFLQLWKFAMLPIMYVYGRYLHGLLHTVSLPSLFLACLGVPVVIYCPTLIRHEWRGCPCAILNRSAKMCSVYRVTLNITVCTMAYAIHIVYLHCNISTTILSTFKYFNRDFRSSFKKTSHLHFWGNHFCM